MFSSNGLVEVLWIQTDALFSVLLWNSHDGADPWGRLLNRRDDTLFHQVIQCALELFSQWDRYPPGCMLYWADTRI